MDTTTHPAADADLDPSPLRMRKALGRFASGVTIVTTAEGESEESVHGMTANAFTSVSLDPPLVLVSIANRARMNAKIAETGRYGVSILACDQEPLSLHFAGAASEPDLVRFTWRRGVPLLDGALVHLSCTVTDSHPAGDHTLHVGRVEELWFDDGRPLLFYTGSFRALELQGDDSWGF
ncbi:flavin reductase family protein [Gordonia sp. VNQ95]|uniref:flavin reductase family protein n=1 Tax=Gordonia sp. VNQ95 TaxID=3156619 RepID=UPI0032B3EF99